MANPRASTSTKNYRQTVKRTDKSGNVSFVDTSGVVQGSRTPPLIGGGGGGGSKSSSAMSAGGSVELFIVGSFFIWMVTSGKLKAIIQAGMS